MRHEKNVFWGMLAIGLIFGMAVIGCASAPVEKGPFVPLGLTLAEALGKYTVPEEQIWGSDGKVDVYYLDPLRFEEFRAELDVGGEYTQTNRSTGIRDWETGKTFGRLGVYPSGRLQLLLGKDDNSFVEYNYQKKGASKTVGPKLAESLARYMAPVRQTWDNNEQVTVYFLDPLRFEEFKAELDIMAGYYQTGNWTYNRDWETGKTFARWAERANGNFELELHRADNSTVHYNYTKGVPRTIEITGFSSETITRIWEIEAYESAEIDWPSRTAASGPELNGQTITSSLVIPERKVTGKLFIVIECNAPQDPSKDGSRYVYSEDGVNPTPVDISPDVTTLEWSKFIWISDYMAG